MRYSREEHTISLIGFYFLTGQLKPIFASCFIRLKDWKNPPEKEHTKKFKKILSKVSQIHEDLF
jgi:hypothetical protein